MLMMMMYDKCLVPYYIEVRKYTNEIVNDIINVPFFTTETETHYIYTHFLHSNLTVDSADSHISKCYLSYERCNKYF